MYTSKQPFHKSKQPFRKSKKPFRKSKKPFRRHPQIGLGEQIDYRNINLIHRFISEQGKILSRRVNRLTLKQQRLITFSIKQARILSLLPFRNNEKLFLFKKAQSIPKPTGPRTRKSRHIPQSTQNYNSNRNLRDSNQNFRKTSQSTQNYNSNRNLRDSNQNFRKTPQPEQNLGLD